MESFFNKLEDLQEVAWFLQRSFVDLFRVCSLHIISRNHSNTILLITPQKTRTCPKKYVLQQQGVFRLRSALFRFYPFQTEKMHFPQVTMQFLKKPCIHIFFALFNNPPPPPPKNRYTRKQPTHFSITP